MNSRETLRVAVATPLSNELCDLIMDREPRVELLCDQSLLPPMRWDADYGGDPSFERSPAQQQKFEDLLKGADALYGIPDVSPAALSRAVNANPGLKWVQAMAAGGGAQVKAAGLSREALDRVVFTTSAGVHAGPLAEFAMFGLLAGAKHLPRLLDLQTKREWSGRWPMGQVSEQTVVVLGLGGIGREVARKAQALGAHVVGVARRTEPVLHVDEVVTTDRLVEIVAKADALVVTLPGTASTEGIVSREVLENIRPGATVVSVGRGTVVDEDALVDALQTKRVGFAALDVFATEPLPASSPLWDLDNVVLSPHTAANSAAEERLIAELFADNASRLLDGLPLRNVVDTVEFY